MTRLDGEKKSPLPWIIGLIVLALLAAAIYYFTANKAPNDAVGVNSTELQNTTPSAMGDANSTDANAMDANTMDANSMDANAMDANAMDANSLTDSNAMAGANATDSNSAMMDNSAMSDSNSAMMNNSAMSDSNSAMMDNSVANTAMPGAMAGATPVAGNAKPNGNGVVATRSKTIETKNATVTYKKTVKEDGSLMHDKTIVPKPVEQAKKMQ